MIPSPLLRTNVRRLSTRRTWHPVAEFALVMLLVAVVVAGMWFYSWR